MDQNFRIYSAPEGEIPAEDKARYEGFLQGLAARETAEEAAARYLDDPKTDEEYRRRAAEDIEARIRELEERDRG